MNMINAEKTVQIRKILRKIADDDQENRKILINLQNELENALTREEIEKINNGEILKIPTILFALQVADQTGVLEIVSEQEHKYILTYDCELNENEYQEELKELEKTWTNLLLEE